MRIALSLFGVELLAIEVLHAALVPAEEEPVVAYGFALPDGTPEIAD